MSDVKEVYQKLAHKLPSFEEVNSEFEIEDIETNFLLRNILRKAAEKIEFYVGVLGDLLQPDTGSLSSMHETRFFTDSEKEQMYTLFKKLMKLHRAIIESVLGKQESEQAEFLNHLFTEWKTIKKDLLTIIGKMKDCWDKEALIQTDVGYFG